MDVTAVVPFDSALSSAISTYGAWIVGAAVAVESMGIPVPGETMLVTAAGIAAAAAVVVALVVARRFERRLEDAAERALPRSAAGTRELIR